MSYVRPGRGKVELRNVGFRYAPTEPFVFANLSLVVEAGQSVTIVGPSGCGKTTLMKIMLGLLEPTDGQVLIDDVPLSGLGVKGYREHIAAVMQEDELLSGSIADNICFFDTGFDEERMFRCAEIAGIHDDIMAMPMAYNSLVGDMGSSLSSGQKQRVLLARALYRQPRILFIDEGTAHVDVAKEKHIYDALRLLDLTLICIAHRPDLLAYADRVFNLGDPGGALISSAGPGQASRSGLSASAADRTLRPRFSPSADASRATAAPSLTAIPFATLARSSTASVAAAKSSPQQPPHTLLAALKDIEAGLKPNNTPPCP